MYVCMYVMHLSEVLKFLRHSCAEENCLALTFEFVNDIVHFFVEACMYECMYDACMHVSLCIYECMYAQ